MKNRVRILIFHLFALIAASHCLYAADLIDVVYTWVDGSDPEWQKCLKEYAEKEQNLTVSSIAKKRFNNHDELRYSLRSIYEFAPWVNHIYIVTFGQRPKWLMDTPMVTVVDHKEIFTNPDDLPTFNSMAIECHLQQIPGLQEHYLYFNDDVFLGKPVTPEDFFSPADKMKIFLSKRELPLGLPTPGEEGFFAASKNTRILMGTTFGSEPQFMHSHTPYPTLKSFVKEVEEHFSEIFTKVSSHRFRSIDDYLITNGIIPYSALYTEVGELIPDQGTTYTFGRDPSHDLKMFKKLTSDQPRFFCIQDDSDGDEENPQSLFLLDSFFNEYFPTPAPWENDRGQKELKTQVPRA